MSKKSFRLTDVNFARNPTCPHCGSLQNRRKFLHSTGELRQALGEHEAGGKREGRSARTRAPSLARDSHFAPPYTVQLKNAKKITPVLLKKILGNRATFLHIKRPDKMLNPT